MSKMLFQMVLVRESSYTQNTYGVYQIDVNILFVISITLNVRVCHELASDQKFGILIVSRSKVEHTRNKN